MPISSPTEFLPASGAPPTRIIGSTAGAGATGVRLFLAGYQAGQFTQPINDLIVIGASALSAGSNAVPVVDTNLAGSVVIGSGAAQNLTATTAFAARGPSTIIGFNALHLSPLATANTVIGSQAAGVYTNDPFPTAFINGNVIVGEQAFNNIDHPNFGTSTGVTQNVIIGVQASAPSALQKLSFNDNVIVGFNSGGSLGVGTGPSGGGLQHNVILGSQAAAHFQSVASANYSSDNVYIGYVCDDQGSPSANVIIGSGANAALSAVNSPKNNVGIGSSGGGVGCVAGSFDNVVIGSEAINQNGNQRCIMFGRGLGRSTGNAIPARNDQLLFETVATPPGGTRRTMLYGVMCDGATAGTGLVIGFSTEGTNRDIQGVGTLKLLNSTKGGANPLGGGYWYVSAGVLHWVDSAGIDTQLSLSVAGQLASSALTAYSNNAAAAAGTLTNAPAAGNPTKWIPINDNGTIRNIPAW